MTTRMIAANSFVDSSAAYWLTLSLGHTLWQITLIGLIALIVTHFLRIRSAQPRYMVHMGAIGLMVLCLPINLLWIGSVEAQQTEQAASDPIEIYVHEKEVEPDDLAADTQSPFTPDVPQDSLLEADNERAETSPLASRDIPAALDEPNLGGEREQALDIDVADPDQSEMTGVVSWRSCTPWVVASYLLGLLLALIRLIFAYHGGQRLRRLAEPVGDLYPGLLDRYTDLADRLGLRQHPKLGILSAEGSARFPGVGPVVIGVLKPMVILPAAVLTQMTPAQIEAVLAHELAHIRRFDPWLMIFQRSAETVLFFHPMLWLISRLASIEREHACDDLALKAGAQPSHYAEAILHILKCQAQGHARRPSFAAAALSMAQSPAKALEHRLARLFGQRIPNPLRLTRKGLIGIALVGIVGLTALITTTRAQAPDNYFAEAEVIPLLSLPVIDDPPHPAIAMDIQYVRPTHTDVLFTPNGDRLEDTWDDAGSHHPLWDQGEVLRDIIIDLPQDTPELHFVQNQHKFNAVGKDTSIGAPFFAYTRHRADGTRYVILELQYKPEHYQHVTHHDITLAYFVGDERGEAALEFVGPFEVNKPFKDTTGRYSTQLKQKGTKRTDTTLTIRLDRAFETGPTLTVVDSQGKTYDFVSSRYHADRNANGRAFGTYTFDLQGTPPDQIRAIMLAPAPRTKTFRNVRLRWERWEEIDSPYAPYIDEMAKRLGIEIKDQQDAETLMRRDLSADEALDVIDVVRHRNSAMHVWSALRDHYVLDPDTGEPIKRLTFDDYDEDAQAKIIAAAEHWIDSARPAMQRLGLEMGLWTGDMRFWDPAIALLSTNPGSRWNLYIALGRNLRSTMQQQHFRQIIDLFDQQQNTGMNDALMWIFRETGTTKNPPERRQMTIDALIELAHHDRPEVWYLAISRFVEQSWTLSDANGRPARETVLAQLAAESDEMLRRCAIVVPDEKLLGQPIPPRDQLRLEELFTTKMWRENGANTFHQLYRTWIDTDPIDADQWALAINFLAQLDHDWHRSQMPAFTRDNNYVVDHIVQHLNASFDQNIGGLGQKREHTNSPSIYDWQQIARDAVKWYRGPDGPGPQRPVELAGSGAIAIQALADQGDGVYRWRIENPGELYLTSGIGYVESVRDGQAIVKGQFNGSDGTPRKGPVELHVSAEIKDGKLKIEKFVGRVEDGKRLGSTSGQSPDVPEGAELIIVPGGELEDKSVNAGWRHTARTTLAKNRYTPLWEARVVLEGKVIQSVILALRQLNDYEINHETQKHFNLKLARGAAMPAAKDPALLFERFDFGAVDRADVIGVWQLNQGAAPNEISDTAQRNYRMTQTLELRKDGSAVWQVVKRYTDDKQEPIDFKRFEGGWSLGDSPPLNGGPGEGLFLSKAVGAEADKQVTDRIYLGSVSSGSAKNHPDAPLTLSRWGGSISIMHDWQPITADEAGELDPGRQSAIRTAEAFASALLKGDPGTAHALTHEIDLRTCSSLARIALYPLPADFAIDRVYQVKQGDERFFLFTPITIPAKLTGQEQDEPRVLAIRVGQQAGTWRVVEVNLERVGERLEKQLIDAEADDKIIRIEHQGAALRGRLVALKENHSLNLHRAVLMGDAKAVAELIRVHGDNWTNSRLAFNDNETPLHTTTRHLRLSRSADNAKQMLAVMRVLLQRGVADVNAVDDDRYTALHMLCARYGYLHADQVPFCKKALQLLIEAGADVNLASHDGRSPLLSLAMSMHGRHNAPKHHVAEAAALLIEAGAKPNPEPTQSSGDRYQTPIESAIQTLNPELVKLLLDSGINPNKPTAQGLYLLHSVSDVRRREGNYRDKDYQAGLNNHAVACAKALIEAGADPLALCRTSAVDFKFINLPATAYDIAPDGPLRDYLGTLVKPTIAKKRAQARKVCEVFIQGALNDQVDEMLAVTTVNWPGIYGNFPGMLKSRAKEIRSELEQPGDGQPFVLPIEGDAVFMREAVFLLRNKPGSDKAYRYIVLIEDGDRWRVIESRATDRQKHIDAWVINLFNLYADNDIISYTRYTGSGELPPIKIRKNTERTGLPTNQAITATAVVDQNGGFRINWHSKAQREAQTYLSDPNAKGIVHLDHRFCRILHTDFADKHGLKISRATITFNDKANEQTITLDDNGRLRLQIGNQTQTLPRGTAIKIDLTNLSIEVDRPAKAIGRVDDADNALAGWAKAVPDERWQSAMEAGLTLAAQAPAGPDRRPEALRGLDQRDDRQEVYRQTITSLEQLSAVPSRQWTPAHRDVRDQAIQVLRYAGAEANPLLREAIEHEQPTMRKQIVPLFARMGRPALDTLHELALRDPDRGVRSSAVSHINMIAARESIPTLIKALEDDASSVRSQAAAALGNLHAQEAMEPLAAALARDTRLSWGAVIEAMHQIDPDQSRKMIEKVADEMLINEPLDKHQAQAIRDRAQAQNIPQPSRAVSNELEPIRQIIWQTETVAGETYGIQKIQALIEHIDHPLYSISAGSCRALAYLGTQQAAPVLIKLVEQGLANELSGTRGWYYQTLAVIGGKHALQSLVEAYRDTRGTIIGRMQRKRSIAEALGVMGETGIPMLMLMLGDPEMMPDAQSLDERPRRSSTVEGIPELPPSHPVLFALSGALNCTQWHNLAGGARGLQPSLREQIDAMKRWWDENEKAYLAGEAVPDPPKVMLYFIST